MYVCVIYLFIRLFIHFINTLTEITRISIKRGSMEGPAQITLIWLFKVTKGPTYYAIQSATHDLRLVFYSNYITISHVNSVFQQMALIWPFKVTKGQTDNAIRFATHDLLLVFYGSYSAISHVNPVFQQ